MKQIIIQSLFKEAVVSTAVSALINAIGKQILGGMKSRRKNNYFSETKTQILALFDKEEEQASVAEWLESDGSDLFMLGMANNDLNELRADWQAGVQRDLASKKGVSISESQAKSIVDIIVNKGFEYLQAFEKDDCIIAMCSALHRLGNESLAVLKTIAQMIAESQVNVWTPEDVNLYFRQNTKPFNEGHYFSLSFFCLGENDVKGSLEDAIASGAFVISHYSREEAVYMMCDFLIRKHPKSNVFIVRDERSWQALSRDPDINAFYLADFPIQTPIGKMEKGVSIFFYPSDERSDSLPTVAFQLRTASSIENGFKEIGMTDEQSIDLMQKTGGFYTPILASLWNGAFPMYDEFKDHAATIRALLLCPTFEDSEEEIKYMASLSKQSPSEFEKSVKALREGENPILELCHSLSGKTRYRVVCIDALWNKFKKLIDVKNYHAFINSILKIGSNRIFDEYGPFIERLRGIIQSLTYACCFIDEAYQAIADHFVRRVLSELDFSKYLSFANVVSLAELSPRETLDCLDERKEELSQYFDEDTEVYKKNPYNHEFTTICALIRDTVEFAGYAEDAYSLLAYFANKENLVHSNWSPKPGEALGGLLLPWYNESGLSLNDKKRLVQHLYKLYPEMLFQISLTGMQKTSGFGYSLGRVLRQRNEITPVSPADDLDYRDFQIEMLIAHCDLDKAVNMLISAHSIGLTEQQCAPLLQIVASKLPLQPDKRKESFVHGLRKAVYDGRFYNWDYYQQSTDLLDKLTIIIEQQHFKNPYYEYLYLCTANIHRPPLLNPEPYDSDNHEEANREQFRKLSVEKLGALSRLNAAKAKFLRFVKAQGVKERDLCIDFFIYGTVTFDEEWFNALCDVGYSFPAHKYLTHFKNTKNELRDYLPYIKSEKVRAMVFSDLPVDETLLAELKKESPLVQKTFWEECHIPTPETEKIYKICLEELTRKNPEQALSLLDSSCKKANESCELSPEETLQYLFKICRSPRLKKTRSLVSYEATKIIISLVGRIDETMDVLLKASELELTFAEEGSHRLLFHFTKTLWKRSALEYAKIVANTYSNTKYGKYSVHSLFQIYPEIRFCPGEENGAVDFERLSEWAKEFEAALQKLNIEYMYHIQMGKTLAYAIDQEGDVVNSEGALRFIEEENDKDLDQSVAVAILNLHGMHTVDEGHSLANLSARYVEKADKVKKMGYQRGYRILKSVADDYDARAQAERDEARHVRR